MLIQYRKQTIPTREKKQKKDYSEVSCANLLWFFLRDFTFELSIPATTTAQTILMLPKKHTITALRTGSTYTNNLIAFHFIDFSFLHKLFLLLRSRLFCLF